MSERHLAQRLLQTVKLLNRVANDLNMVTSNSLNPMNHLVAKVAADCRLQAEELRKALQAEGYDRVY